MRLIVPQKPGPIQRRPKTLPTVLRRRLISCLPLPKIPKEEETKTRKTIAAGSEAADVAEVGAASVCPIRNLPALVPIVLRRSMLRQKLRTMRPGKKEASRERRRGQNDRSDPNTGLRRDTSQLCFPASRSRNIRDSAKPRVRGNNRAGNIPLIRRVRKLFLRSPRLSRTMSPYFPRQSSPKQRLLKLASQRRSLPTRRVPATSAHRFRKYLSSRHPANSTRPLSTSHLPNGIASKSAFTR